MELDTEDRNIQKNENNIVVSEAIDTEPFIMDLLHLHTHFAKHGFHD